MHDGDEPHLELGLHITDNMLDGGCNGVVSCEWRDHNNAEVFDLKVSLV